MGALGAWGDDNSAVHNINAGLVVKLTSLRDFLLLFPSVLLLLHVATALFVVRVHSKF